MNTIPNNQTLPGSSLTDPGQLEELGKQAAQLAEKGISLTDALVDTVGHLKLNQEQVRRVVESANITAVNLKYASADPSFRYPVLDDGPADPVEVMQRVAAATSPADMTLDALEYSAPPTTKFASIQFVPDFVEDDSAAVRAAALQLLELRNKLSAAQDQVIQNIEGAKGQLELDLVHLNDAFKTAQNNGASDSEIFYAWAKTSAAVAEVVWRKLTDEQPPAAVKVAGRRISEHHPVMTKFASIVQTLNSLASHQGALRAIEAELQRFFSED